MTATAMTSLGEPHVAAVAVFLHISCVVLIHCGDVAAACAVPSI
jgi:hypothetical protein